MDQEVKPGWLPPRAPGAGPAPRFHPEPEDPAGEGASAPPAADPPPAPATPPGWAPPAPGGAPSERGYGQPVGPPPSTGPQEQRPTFVTARGRPAAAEAPSSPLAVASLALGAVAILLLVFTLGVGFLLCGVVALLALGLGVQARRRINAGLPGRPGQARAAVVLASVALGLALVAAIVWTALDASGFSPQDLQEWLEDEIDRRQERSAPRGGDVA